MRHRTAHMLEMELESLESLPWLLLAIYVAHQLWKICREFMEIRAKQLNSKFEVIFFTDKGIRNQSGMVTLETFTKPICDFIQRAERELIVCFYVISAHNVVEAILNAKRRGVDVKVIVDYYFGFEHSQYTRKFIKEGVPVYAKKYDHNTTIMHLKFCLCDNDCLLLGSMNITQSACKGSFENLLITKHPQLLNAFRQVVKTMLDEFEVMVD